MENMVSTNQDAIKAIDEAIEIYSGPDSDDYDDVREAFGWFALKNYFPYRKDLAVEDESWWYGDEEGGANPYPNVKTDKWQYQDIAHVTQIRQHKTAM